MEIINNTLNINKNAMISKYRNKNIWTPTVDMFLNYSFAALTTVTRL